MSSICPPTSGSTIYGSSEPGRKLAKDFYPTPEWVTQALLARESFPGLVWEPAAGEGHLSRVLLRNGLEVFSTELREDLDYGFRGIDFLKSSKHNVDHIITNPPFSLASEFVEHAKHNAQKKVAMFLRLQFLEGQKRYPLFQDREFPLKVVYVFSRRVTFKLGELDQKGGSQIAFAWFVWDKGYRGPVQIQWIAP